MPRRPRQVGDEAGAFPRAQFTPFTPFALAKLMIARGISYGLVYMDLMGFNQSVYI